MFILQICIGLFILNILLFYINFKLLPKIDKILKLKNQNSFSYPFIPIHNTIPEEFLGSLIILFPFGLVLHFTQIVFISCYLLWFLLLKITPIFFILFFKTGLLCKRILNVS